MFLTGINFLRFQYFSRLLGLCNNFGYVVMLSAAHDILAVNGTDQVLRNNLFQGSVATFVTARKRYITMVAKFQDLNDPS